MNTVERGDRLTVADQQIRTSYLWCCCRPCKRYQDSRPCVSFLSGDVTGRDVRSVGLAGDNTDNLSSASPGPSSDNKVFSGATNMIFSVLAATPSTQQQSVRSRTRRRMVDNNNLSLKRVSTDTSLLLVLRSLQV